MRVHLERRNRHEQQLSHAFSVVVVVVLCLHIWESGTPDGRGEGGSTRSHRRTHDVNCSGLLVTAAVRVIS